MANLKDDSKPVTIEPPRVSKARTGNKADANGMIDNLLENVGLKSSEGGSA